MSVGANLPVHGLVDAQDRAYVENLEDGELRTTVLSSLLLHRQPDRLRPGDPLPALSLVDPHDGRAVPLATLLDGQPLVLVFGSHT